MASLKKNVIANYSGNLWSALMSLAFVPLYIKYLGMESYGLIGVFALLQSWLSLLNMGLTPTLSREMARFTAGAHTPHSIRELFYSLSLVVLSLSLFIGVLVWCAAPWLAVSWLHAEKLPPGAVAQAISIMGVVAALKFMEGLYQGAILGLQRQVWLNVVSAFLATLRGAGAVGILVWVEPTLNAFFIWQGILSLVTVLVFLLAIRRWLPPAGQPVRYSRQALAGVKSFAGGLMLTSLLSMLLLSVDKLLLTRMLSLEAFGQYTLAASIAATIYQFVTPVNQAFYPRLTELAARGDEAALAATYHRGAQVVSVVIAPVALVLAAFGQVILTLWTGNAGLSALVAPLLSLLVIGNALHSLMYVPYSLQLAYGWTSFANYVNGVAVALLVPGILILVPRYGAKASALIWITLTVGYVLFSAQFMHRRLLKGEKWRWYLLDILAPISGAAAMVISSRILHPGGMSKIMEIVWLLGTWCCACAASALLAPEIKAQLDLYLKTANYKLKKGSSFT